MRPDRHRHADNLYGAAGAAAETAAAAAAIVHPAELGERLGDPVGKVGMVCIHWHATHLQAKISRGELVAVDLLRLRAKPAESPCWAAESTLTAKRSARMNSS